MLAASATVMFGPEAAFRGTAHGIRYRLTDEYGQSATGTYVPTVTGGSSGSGGTGGSGGGTGLVADCRVTLVATVGGRRITIGSGVNSPDANVANLVVRVQLTARGRQLSRETRGVAVHAQATAAVAGLPGRVSGAVDLRAIAPSFLLTHSVKFAARSARLTPNERRYLTSLVRTLQGVKRIDCIGAARDVRKGSRRTSLARSRAKAVCTYLRARLPHGVKLAPRAEHAGDRRGTTRHADLLLRY